MSVEPHRRVSIEDYLAAERGAETKSEYLDGEVFAMSGASLQHNRVVWNLAGSLYNQLRGAWVRSFCQRHAGPHPGDRPLHSSGFDRL